MATLAHPSWTKFETSRKAEPAYRTSLAIDCLKDQCKSQQAVAPAVHRLEQWQRDEGNYRHAIDSELVRFRQNCFLALR